MGILDHSKIWRVVTDEFTVGTVGTDVYMDFGNGKIITDDTFTYIDNFCTRLLNIDFNSVLIAGLGLGMFAQYIADNSLCETIDVVEINPTLIYTMSNYGIYDSRVVTIQSDIFTYTPVQQYDVILFDLWWAAYLPETFTNDINTLKNRYNTYLTDTGYTYFPVLGAIGQQDTFFKV